MATGTYVSSPEYLKLYKESEITREPGGKIFLKPGIEQRWDTGRSLEGTLPAPSDTSPSAERTLPDTTSNLDNFKSVLRQAALLGRSETRPTPDQELARYAQAGVPLTAPSSISTALDQGTLGRREVENTVFKGALDLIKSQEEEQANRQKANLDFAQQMTTMLTKSPALFASLSGQDFEDLKSGKVSDDLLKKIGEAAKANPSSENTQVVEFGGKKVLIDSKTGETIKELGSASNGAGGASVAQVTSLANQLYEADAKDLTGKYNSYEEARADAERQLGGAISYGGGGTSTGAGGGFQTGATGMRTDRNNNPTAMTVDVARTLGLKEGTDYVAGDPWYELNGQMVPAGTPGARIVGTTAKIVGDPVMVTIKGLDKAANDLSVSAFYTKNGQQRWTHTAMTDKDWLALSEEGKKAVVAQMYQREGGNGSLVQGQATAPITATETSPQITAYARQYMETGKMPTGISTRAMEKVAEAARTMPKPDGMIYSVSTGVKPDSLSATQLDGLSALYDIKKKVAQLKELDKQRVGGLVGGTLGFVTGSANQQRYVALRNELVDLLARARSGAALTTSEERRYTAMLPGRWSEPLKLGPDSQLKIENFETNITGTLNTRLNAFGVGISGYDPKQESKVVNGKTYVRLSDNQWHLAQ